MQRHLLLVAALAGAALVTAVAALAARSGTAETLGSELATVRAATAQYHRLEFALTDGFFQTSPCVANPTGGMGFHLRQPSRIDGQAVAAEPEVLVYAPAPDGRRQLVAVEYVVPVALSPTRPTLFGRPFDGPFNVSAPWGTQWDLHAWVWKHNPDGMFARFNPEVSYP